MTDLMGSVQRPLKAHGVALVYMIDELGVHGGKSRRPGPSSSCVRAYYEPASC